MYHEIIDEGADNRDLFRIMQKSYFVGREVFEDQLRYLKSEGFSTISLDTMIRHIRNPAAEPLPAKSVILTFDDGYYGNYAYALPLLQKYGLSAVFFVTIKLIGTPLMLGWEHLKEMAAAGMSIQSHTMTHPFLRQLTATDAARELIDSKLIIEKKLGTQVLYLSLPNGSYGKSYKAIAGRAGYAGGCCSKIGYNTSSTDRYLLRRIHVSGSYRREEFRKIMTATGCFVPFLALKKDIKSMVRAGLGEQLYARIYRTLFGIKKM